ncbi:MAG: hypothetical protein C0464_00515 [Cyanobacteria bacterium DS2.008]|nr:hypothetical protein [Cyanobacteria bacterium DS2.008]
MLIRDFVLTTAHQEFQVKNALFTSFSQPRTSAKLRIKSAKGLSRGNNDSVEILMKYNESAKTSARKFFS